MTMRNATVAIISGLIVLQTTGGCAPKKEEVWTPPPHVGWTNIGTQPLGEPHESYRILVDAPTKGLFPAEIGVTRVGPSTQDDHRVPGDWMLLRDPRNELLRWNSAFDDQMAVSAVFPIAQRDLGGAPTTPEQILAANHALDARIALIYAMNQLTETESEMIGALYDAESGQPLASFHASAVSLPPPEDQADDEPADPWKTDSKALVRAKFERIVYACIRELIARDLPAEIQSRDGWVPEGPIEPVQWPPRLFR